MCTPRSSSTSYEEEEVVIETLTIVTSSFEEPVPTDMGDNDSDTNNTRDNFPHTDEEDDKIPSVRRVSKGDDIVIEKDRMDEVVGTKVSDPTQVVDDTNVSALKGDEFVIEKDRTDEVVGTKVSDPTQVDDNLSVGALKGEEMVIEKDRMDEVVGTKVSDPYAS